VYTNPITNAGDLRIDQSGNRIYNITTPYEKRCRMAQALDAFLFFALVASALGLLLDLSTLDTSPLFNLRPDAIIRRLQKQSSTLPITKSLVVRLGSSSMGAGSLGV